MDMIGKIRRLIRRGKKSAREIARLTGLSRNTAAKWWYGEIEGGPVHVAGLVTHVGILASWRQQMSDAAAKWQKRLTLARQLIAQAQ